MSTANTLGVFREAIGRRIVGLYCESYEHAGRVVVLVLDDGTGLAFGTGNGSHWTVNAEDMARRVAARREELAQLEADMRDVLATEGVLGVEPGEGAKP